MEHKAAIVHYCNYQERSHHEVRNKLYEIGCKTQEVNDLLAYLIEQNLLNEERYARAYARGKFRIKHWGKNKIIQQLRLFKVSDYCIHKAMTEIDEEEYENTLHKTAEKKWQELKTERSPRIKQAKLYRFLLQRGFETAIINNAIKKLLNDSE
jgi:regulatory protein